MKRSAASLFLFVGVAVCFAEVELPKVINSKMVLQRGVAAPVWGWADPGEEVTVQFDGQVKKAMPGENGTWMVRLDPLIASSEPRMMTIKGRNEIRLIDILVGEVWLASGQSNMEWTFQNLAPDEKTFVLTQIDNKLVRAFHVEHHLEAGIPMDDTLGRWKNCRDMLGGDLNSVSAVGFFFALKLQQELGVPVAILDANWGGKRIELFIPDEGYQAIGVNYRKRPASRDPVSQLKEMARSIDESVRAAEKGIKRPYIENRIYGSSDNSIYNAMIAPLTPYAIKGAIWYQGESNRSLRDYFQKLQGLSAGWSKVFNVEDIPIHQAQIAPYDYSRGKGPISSMLCDNIWAAQYRGADEIPGMSMVPTHDTNIDTADIHPKHKRTVGERLAAKALKNQYGKAVVTTGPSFAAAKRDGTKVMVSFGDVDQGLTTADGQAPSWFELSADGKTFVKADAVLNDNTVEVFATDVPSPKFVRMGWYDTAIPNLADKNGWPVFAFSAKPVGPVGEEP
jgi:sialate O-acetylesterase